MSTYNFYFLIKSRAEKPCKYLLSCKIKTKTQGSQFCLRWNFRGFCFPMLAIGQDPEGQREREQWTQRFRLEPPDDRACLICLTQVSLFVLTLFWCHFRCIGSFPKGIRLYNLCLSKLRNNLHALLLTVLHTLFRAARLPVRVVYPGIRSWAPHCSGSCFSAAFPSLSASQSFPDSLAFDLLQSNGLSSCRTFRFGLSEAHWCFHWGCEEEHLRSDAVTW